MEWYVEIGQRNTVQMVTSMCRCKMAYPNKQRNKHNHYFMADGILMHSMKNGLSDITQIVVPKCLRKRILIVSHEADMAGYLGSKKTVFCPQSLK